MMLRARKFFALSFSLGFALLLAWTSSSAAQHRGGIVVADNELASRAGMEILRRGGNAVDAAVATAFALGVVDPASSGLGGGGFMVIYQAKEKKAHALDFRETAPAKASRSLYMKGGKPDPSLSSTGPLAVAVPGEVGGLTEALKRFGTLPRMAVMAPAIRYAAEGVPVSPFLRYAVERHLSALRQSPELARVFLVKGEAPKEGELLRQPELAESLKAIAERGPEVFYQGWIAEAIAAKIKKEGGVLTVEDLKSYKPVWREPILGHYRKRLIITMPPPSSGGIALVQMLNVLEGYRLGIIPHNSATELHLLAETMKHAFADRAQYLGDPDFVQVPVQKLISKDYAAWIRTQISPVKTQPLKSYGLAYFKPEQGGTTHFGVLDKDGNAVSCSLTINTRFGSKLMAPGTGIVLNNEMDDFAIHPRVPNVYGLVGVEANSVRPKKRPLSSMTPAIVLQNDRPFLIVGAAGGPRIISATLQTIVNVLDFNMPLEKAVESARIHHQWIPDELFVEKTIPPSTKKSLERRGHKLKQKEHLGVVQAILLRRSKISGVADPRKEEKANRQ